MEQTKSKSPWYIRYTPLLLKLTKLLKAIKVFSVMISLLSGLFFAGAISLTMGIYLGIGVTILLFVHECGHAGSLYRLGYGLKLPVFIPFLGAVIFAPRVMTRREEATMAFAGPLLGTAGGIFAASLYLLSPHPILLSLALLTIFLNLFNMLPVPPLDGGRILRGAHDATRWLGLLLLIPISYFLHSPVIILIWIIIISDLPFSEYAKILITAFCILLLAVGAVLHLPQTTPAAVEWYGDAILGLLFGLMTIASSYDELSSESPKAPPRSYEAMPIRLAWFALWAGLVFLQFIFLLVLMLINDHATVTVIS